MSDENRTALLFPGQGAQQVGMAVGLCERSEIASELFRQAADVLGYDLFEKCKNGPADELNKTEFCQPALFVHSYATLKQLESDRPDLWDSVSAVAGLSLGEYTAVAAAGGLSFEDGVKLVSIRGKAMQAAADATDSAMASVIGLAEDKLNEVCKAASTDSEFAQVANLLCPGNIAISGHTAAVDRAEGLSSEAGAMKTVRLAVAGAFHTEIMRPAVETLEQALSGVSFQTTKVPVISNVDAAPHTEPEEFRQLLSRQVVAPVQWESSLRAMLDGGTQKFIEIGTGRVLAGTLKRVSRKTPCENVGD